jgi:hypothetical protein
MLFANRARCDDAVAESGEEVGDRSIDGFRAFASANEVVHECLQANRDDWLW